MLSFPDALRIAIEQEKVVAEALCNHFNPCRVEQMSQDCEYWDGIIMKDGDNAPIPYEVKDERNKSQKTGNHFVELQSRGKASGINVSKASLWVVQTTETTILVTPTEELRLGMFQNKWKMVRGGDKDSTGVGTSLGMLVPIKWIESHPKTITINLVKSDISTDAT